MPFHDDLVGTGAEHVVDLQRIAQNIDAVIVVDSVRDRKCRRTLFALHDGNVRIARLLQRRSRKWGTRA
ncbi:hypothetical protein D3C84_1004200 [compost metagenome]